MVKESICRPGSEKISRKRAHGRLIGAVGLDALGDAADDLPAGSGVGIEGHGDAEVVEGSIGDVQDGGIVGVGHQQSLVSQALVEHPLGQSGNIGTEDVAGAEVDPSGGLFRGLRHGGHIVLGQLHMGRGHPGLVRPGKHG